MVKFERLPEYTRIHSLSEMLHFSGCVFKTLSEKTWSVLTGQRLHVFYICAL